MLRTIFLVVAALAVLGAQAQYVAGDLVSNASGLWGTPGTWKVYDGMSIATSPAASAAPNANQTVWIRNGHTVTAVFGTQWACANLTVEAGGKLMDNWMTGDSQNNLTYIGIYDSYLNNYGEIGNGSTYNGISFNIEGSSVTINGTGPFNAGRLNKRINFHVMTAAPLVTTNLIINTNINLRFPGTALFNYGDMISSGGSTFNVTISASYTVALLGAGGSVSIDGSAGADAKALRGAFSVFGTLTMPGTLYLTTNNASGGNTSLTIQSGGAVICSNINAPASASAANGHLLSMAAGSSLEMTGSPGWITYSPTNNTYSLSPTSRVIYSAAGAQDVWNIAGQYGHLRVKTSGTKLMKGSFTVRGDLEIQGAAVLDASTSLYNLTVQGNWTNYNQSGFNERNSTAFVSFNGTALQTLTTTGGEVFNILRVAKTTAPALVMNSDVSVTSTLQLNNGELELNGNMLTLSNPLAAAITTTGTLGPATHIRSERMDNMSRVRWNIGTTLGAHTVPFGSTTGSIYIPFTFDLVLGDAGNVTMATYGTPANNLSWPVTPIAVTNLASSIGLLPDNRDATVDRFWEVDVTGPNPTAGLGFTYAASELPLVPYNDPFSMKAQRWNSSTQQWEPQIEGNSAAYSATTDVVVSTFGPFTLSPVISPLPVELLSFDAKPEGGVVRLEWMTATERDNDHFTVLRSADGIDFEEVLRVRGAGNSNVPLSYTDLDLEPLSGTSYYKLRQTDTDGRSSESVVVAVHMAGKGEVTLFPNPVSEVLSVAGLDGATEIRVFDCTGRQVLGQQANGAARVDLNVAQLPAGAYWLQAIPPTDASSMRFVRK